MAQINYSGNTKATITNNAVAEKAYDAGSLQHAKASEIQTEADGTKYVLKDATRFVQLYRVNQWIGIPQGDSVIIGIETSEEAVHFAKMNGVDGLDVVLA